ncbi:hypothetical protein SUGI_0172760 [Cryptomeria japonica]|uniref:uncharacterized protein LOC131078896 n=1 Tax=Cryptomeria japonica TaxID=3369 RepID=UPI002408E56A|nr:uncharacterized protein LOC131078896 [Cryptomeria japonica]GLJ11612.1 hypothetical protein SUGI_0172760 [Cryptomeria japonica]
MDDLIKGFIRTKLQQEETEDDNAAPPSYIDRSTWAEVLSGHKEEEANYVEEAENSKNGIHFNEEFKQQEKKKHSRFSWQEQQNEVVSGHNQEEYNYEEEAENSKNAIHFNEEFKQQEKKKQSKFPWQEQQNEAAADSEVWETVGEHHSKSPQKYYKVSTEQGQSYKMPPSEQSYADGVGDDIDLEPTEEEISDLSRACNRLWELDLNRLVPGQDYEIDCGKGKKPYNEGDDAPNVLFSWVNKHVFRRPTYSRFYVLLDNYNPSQGSHEVVTSEEEQEQTAFIEEISRTVPIKYLHKYLVAKGLTSPNYAVFKGKLKSIWFDLLDRCGTSDNSSAFEHVFVGEIKRHQTKEVSGFHNWIQFYLEESKGRVDYQGYIYPRRRGQFPDSETQLLTAQFTWNGVLKSVSSVLIGVSPEFEIALYTLCFCVGRQDNHVELGPYNVNIKCYPLEGDKIGSVFPIAED